MLTESELDQVSGGFDLIEEFQSGIFRGIGDKLIVGSVVTLLTPTLTLFGKRISDAIENSLFGKPEAKEKSSKETQEPKANPATA